MLDHHRRMLNFDHWANLIVLDAVAPVAERVPRSVAWLNHILGAKLVWLARVVGGEAPFSVNPTLAIRDLHEHFVLAHEEWSRFLDRQSNVDVARRIDYRNLNGEPFSSALGEILAHVPVHGQHHRGQINADLRAAGAAPPSIDFIHAARTGAV